MLSSKNLKTVRQLAQTSPAFSEAALRWLIFNAAVNGLNSALVRIGRRVLIDEDQFSLWLEGHRERGATMEKASG
jgi:hypothetical protein